MKVFVKNKHSMVIKYDFPFGWIFYLNGSEVGRTSSRTRKNIWIGELLSDGYSKV